MAFWNRKKKAGNPGITDSVPVEMPQDGNIPGKSLDFIEEIADTKQEKFSSVDKKDQKRFVRECCESAMENDKQITEAKKEYEKIIENVSFIEKKKNVRNI